MMVNLSKRELKLLRIALGDAAEYEEEFIAAHIQPWSNGKIMRGYAGLVVKRRRWIAAFKKLYKKLTEVGK